MGKIWRAGQVNLAVLARFEGTTKNRSSTFSRKKSAPQTKSWLRLWVVTSGDVNKRVKYRVKTLTDWYEVVSRNDAFQFNDKLMIRIVINKLKKNFNR